MRETFSKSGFDTTKSALVGQPFCPPPRLSVLILSNSDFENFSLEKSSLVNNGWSKIFIFGQIKLKIHQNEAVAMGIVEIDGKS